MNTKDFKLYAGLDVKVLQGYGILNFNSVSNTEVEGYQALSPYYGVKYNAETPSVMTGSGLKTAGMGYGFDFGLSFELYQKTKIAIALNDLGAIEWNGNVYEVRDVEIEELGSTGINNYNVFADSDGIIAENSNLGEWDGKRSKSVSLPAHLRFGASHNPIDQLRFGMELLFSFDTDIPGAYTDPYYAAGAQYLPSDWFQLNLGLTYGGGYGFKLPIGFVFKPLNNNGVSWEAGFASRDIISWFKQDDPLVSFVFGFLRFSFGK